MGVARFSFADLCEKPLSSVDYLGLTQVFHTILIDGIPRLDPARRDTARRFINLIDTLYDSRVCLIASAEAEPDDLYQRGDGSDLFVRNRIPAHGNAQRGLSGRAPDGVGCRWSDHLRCGLTIAGRTDFGSRVRAFA